MRVLMYIDNTNEINVNENIIRWIIYVIRLSIIKMIIMSNKSVTRFCCVIWIKSNDICDVEGKVRS